MALSDSENYTRCLFGVHGYPLWVPKPDDNLCAAYRERGISIGDVGIITADGEFDFLFNICLPADDLINLGRTPPNFEEIVLDGPKDVSRDDEKHPPGSHIGSASVKKIGVRGNFALLENALIPAGFNASVSFTSAKSNFGLLCLPDGATRFNLRNLNKFYEAALLNGESWYAHANGHFGRMAVNGSLYLVTGCDKSASWGVASQSTASAECEISLEVRACEMAEGLSVAYSWDRRGPASVRVSGRRDADGQVTRQSHCPFIRGFKISVRSLSKLRSPVKLAVIDSSKPNRFIGTSGASNSYFPGLERRRSSFLGRSGAGRISGDSQETWGDLQPSDLSHSASSEDDSSVETFLERSKPYHPSDAINKWLLETIHSAEVVATHDDIWCSCLDDDGLPDDEELLRRVSTKYTPSCLSNGVALFMNDTVSQREDDTGPYLRGLYLQPKEIFTHNDTNPQSATDAAINVDASDTDFHAGDAELQPVWDSPQPPRTTRGGFAVVSPEIPLRKLEQPIRDEPPFCDHDNISRDMTQISYADGLVANALQTTLASAHHVNDNSKLSKAYIGDDEREEQEEPVDDPPPGDSCSSPDPRSHLAPPAQACVELSNLTIPQLRGFFSSLTTMSQPAASRDRSTLRGLYLPLTGPKGAPEGGTMEELIERLITSTSDRATDLRYREVFLTTYLLFTNCRVVFEELWRALKVTQASIDRSVVDVQKKPKELLNRQSHITDVMRDWCMGAFAPVERQVLVEMKELLRDDPVMTWWARYNPLLMREPQDEDPSEAQEPPTSPGLPMSPDLPSSSGMSPRHIAIALTKVEADNYERIRPADYISFLRGHPGLNNVEAANVINTKVEFWVKGAILVSKALRRRIEVLEFFIHTAEECCQLRNFSSAGAIARALTSPLVQRLTLTRQGITRNSKRILARLNKLLDTSHDYEMYRSVLGESQANCIPWIGVHLQDLRTVLKDHPATIPVGSNDLINFTRCIAFEARLQEVICFKTPKLSNTHDSDKFAHVRAMLQRLELSALLDNKLVKCSELLAVEEEMESHGRRMELAGF